MRISSNDEIMSSFAKAPIRGVRGEGDRFEVDVMCINNAHHARGLRRTPFRLEEIAMGSACALVVPILYFR